MLKVQELREIIRLIDESSINEFTYETNGTKVKIKKEKNDHPTQVIEKEVQQQTAVIEQKAPVTEKKVEQEQAVATSEQEDQKTTKQYDHEIVSPMVGTFYEAPSPESEPYVRVGSEVNENTIVCIVEAMKLFNEIEAEINGEIVEILVKDGELVEYGQPLFRVKTT